MQIMMPPPFRKTETYVVRDIVEHKGKFYIKHTSFNPMPGLLSFLAFKDALPFWDKLLSVFGLSKRMNEYILQMDQDVKNALANESNPECILYWKEIGFCESNTIKV